DAAGVVAGRRVLIDQHRPVPEDALHLALFEVAALLAGVLGDVEAAEADNLRRAVAVAVREGDRRHQDQAHPARIAGRRRAGRGGVVGGVGDAGLEAVVDLGGEVAGLRVDRIADRIGGAGAVLHLLLRVGNAAGVAMAGAGAVGGVEVEAAVVAGVALGAAAA